MVWRLVLSRISPLSDIEKYYTMDDIVSCYIFLLERERQQAKELEKLNRC